MIYTSPQGHNKPGSSIGDKLRRPQQLHMGLAVEGSQCHVAAAELQLAERRVDDLPVQRERLAGGNTGNQVEQGGNGAARGEDGDVVTAAGGIENTLQAALHAGGERLPGLQAIVGMFAIVPALHHQCEQALELAAVLRAIAQDVQGVGLLRQQPGQQRTDHAIGIELIEGRIGLNSRHRAATGLQYFQRQARGILLAAQVACHAAVQPYPELGKVFTQSLALAHAHGREDIIVFGAEGGLAMSDKVEVAHERFRPVGGCCEVRMRHTGCQRKNIQAFEKVV
ncbi:protein of unknown function [Pseudomonas sp. JV551A1]|uniref:Uncharacterized protein n=1 Tax=Pseudomonas inefficax TaxID=2078786 RepID=A0AAQ1PB04_9PSED|nr:protein of unknown function [Pseudomonas sp. JV551A1]SPO62345.1 protein of unknown function [Pseudomonas inefficax]